MTAQEAIEILGLEPLPQEGGYYRQTYKAVGTAIYYLITHDSFSALHRVTKDEIFHFYMGDPVEMIQIDNSDSLKSLIIGSSLKENQRPQVVVPANVWQGTRLLDSGKWALLGCTVCPGFEFSDFELGSRSELIKKFPHHKLIIERFTR